MVRVKVRILSAVATILFVTTPPAVAENAVPGTPEQVTASQLPLDLQATFQAELEAGEMSGFGRENVIGGYIADLRRAQRESEKAGQAPPSEVGAAIEALQRLEAYDAARAAASAALPPGHKKELQKDWEAAENMAGRKGAIEGRIGKLEDELDQAAHLYTQSGGTVTAGGDLRPAIDALEDLMKAMKLASTPVTTPKKAVTEDDGGSTDRRQGDARTRDATDHLKEGYAAGRRDGVRPGPTGVPVKPDY